MTFLAIIGGLCLIWFLPWFLFVGMNLGMHLLDWFWNGKEERQS